MSSDAKTALNNYKNAQLKADDEMPSAELNINDLTLGYGGEWQHYVWESAKRDNVALQLFKVTT